MNIDFMPAITFVLPFTTKTTTGLGDLWFLVAFAFLSSIWVGSASCFLFSTMRHLGLQ